MSESICGKCFASTHGNRICPVCGNDIVDVGRKPMALPLFTKLKGGQYTIGNMLGMGGFGITYIAWDSVRRERCAIKELFLSSGHVMSRDNGAADVYVLNGDSNQSKYCHYMDSFKNEVAILTAVGQIDTSGTVVKAYDSFEENHTHYMTMEYIDGLPLTKYCSNSTTLPEIWELFYRIAQALEHVHDLALLHRDVSPMNILVENHAGKYRYRLIDFGSSRTYSFAGDDNHTALVNQSYSPAEQYSRTGKQGQYTDIYALACTVYHFASGSPPPKNRGTETERNDTLIPLGKIRGDLPQSFLNVLSKAISIDRTKRYQYTAELLDALIRCQSDMMTEKPNIKSEIPVHGEQDIGDPPPPKKKSFIQRLKEFFGGVPSSPDQKPDVSNSTDESISKDAKIVLYIISGDKRGLAFMMPDNGVMTIGASESCYVRLEQKYISRVHCSIIRKIDRKNRVLLYVRDENSRNGTYIGDSTERLAPGVEYEIKLGQKLTLVDSNCTMILDVYTQ